MIRVTALQFEYFMLDMKHLKVTWSHLGQRTETFWSRQTQINVAQQTKL